MTDLKCRQVAACLSLVAAFATRANAAAADGPADGVFERGVVEVEPARGSVSQVTVDNVHGDVRVEGHDNGAVVIHAFKRGPDDATLDRLKVTLLSDPSGPLQIRTRLAPGREVRPLPAGSVQIDLVIQAPRNAAVNARVWNGRLELRGMENGATLIANEGDIEVKSCSGRIVSHNTQGRQAFTEVVGDIDAQGLWGDVWLDLVRGPALAAMVHRGDVVGRKVRSRQVLLSATYGNVAFHGEALVGGTLRLHSGRGDIRVELTRRIPVEVRARALAGRVQVPVALDPERREDGVVVGRYRGSEAGALLQLGANMGDIHLAF